MQNDEDRNGLLLCVILLSLLIIVGCLLPSEFAWKLYKSVSFFKPAVNMFFSSLQDFWNFVHALGFVLLSPLALASVRRPQWQVVFMLIGFAVFVELLQWFAPTRSANIGDVGRNIVGVVIGSMVYYYFKTATAASK